MEMVKMLPVRQIQIVQLIKTTGLNSDDFEFTPNSNDDFELRYKANNTYFFVTRNGSHSYTPAPNGRYTGSGKATKWEDRLQIVGHWLKALKENIEIGDPWKEIKNIKEEMGSLNYDTYEDFFDNQDKQNLELKLNQLIGHFESLKIDTAEIKKDIKHLSKMSDKISKKDWILLFLGNIVGWMFTGLIPPETTQSIWIYVKSLFSGFNLKFLK